MLECDQIIFHADTFIQYPVIPAQYQVMLDISFHSITENNK